MPVSPLPGSVNGLSAMTGDPFAHLAHDGSIHSYSRNDCLSFCERGKFVEELAASPFDGFCHGVLIDWIHDSHDDLRHALRKHVLVELARALSDQSDADPELAALG